MLLFEDWSNTGDKSLLKAKNAILERKTSSVLIQVTPVLHINSIGKQILKPQFNGRADVTLRWNMYSRVNSLCQQETLESARTVLREARTFKRRSNPPDRNVAAKLTQTASKKNNPLECLTKQSTYAKPVIKLLTGFCVAYRTSHVMSCIMSIQGSEVVRSPSMNDLPLATPCVIHGLLWRSKGFFARSGVDIKTMGDWQAALHNRDVKLRKNALNQISDHLFLTSFTRPALRGSKLQPYLVRWPFMRARKKITALKQFVTDSPTRSALALLRVIYSCIISITWAIYWGQKLTLEMQEVISLTCTWQAFSFSPHTRFDRVRDYLWLTGCFESCPVISLSSFEKVWSLFFKQRFTQ